MQSNTEVGSIGEMTNLSKTMHMQLQQKVQIVIIDEGSELQRIDNFLAKHYKDVPKSHLYRILRSGEVRVNKKRIDASYKLQLGDAVRIPPIKTLPKSAPMQTSSKPMLQPYIIFEDDALLVINKPAGIAVHGGSGVSRGIIEQFRAERPQAKFLELVHRLDKETSGVLMLAKKRAALVQLQEAIRQHQTDKRYLVLVQGQWKNAQQRVRLDLQKHALANGERKVTVVKTNPLKAASRGLHNASQALEIQHSETVFYLKQKFAEYTLLEAYLVTGRTHQLRVQLAHLGFPILGDEKYGNFELNKMLQKQGLKRMFLHSYRTIIQHPISKQTLELVAELPQELHRFLESISVHNESNASSI